MDELLVETIRAAFPVGVPPERPVTGHRCNECDETDRLLGGRTWVDVADDFPQYCHDTFPLFTLNAKTYYLPAYMCFEVRSPGYMPGPSVLSDLEHGDFTSEMFTASQRAAIWAWIKAYYGMSGDIPPESVEKVWCSGEK